MSELIQKNDNRATIRWKLLTGASALALAAYAASACAASAEDADRSTVWIELGGQMEAMQGLASPFTAPFMFPTTVPDVYGTNSFIDDQRPPRFAFGGESKITFQPEGSDWLFSASIRYGRSHANRHAHHQTSGQKGIFYTAFLSSIIGTTQFKSVEAFFDAAATYREHHMVLDFSAGKDIGIGLLGHDGTSNINAGVRLMDLTESSTVAIYARPVVGVGYRAPKYNYATPTFAHQYSMTAHAARSFKGIGPSLSWNASAALAGNKQDGELMFDWGINAALLFGKQKAKTDHMTQAYHRTAAYQVYSRLYGPYPHHSTRSRRVSVPNVGGFAGLSVKYPNFKFSVGYRTDVFFGAMDTGIDTAKKSNLAFNGPYASISIGLGD